MANPIFKLDISVDVTPTSHGIKAAPRLASMSMTLPTRAAIGPKQFVRREIVIG